MRQYFLLTFFLLLSIQGHASALTLINKSTHDKEASFHVFQGAHCVARVDVQAGKQASLPTSGDYDISATALWNDSVLTSKTVRIHDHSVDVKAQLVNENGDHSLKLVASPAPAQEDVTLEDQSGEEIRFKLSRPKSSFQFISQLNEKEVDHLSGPSSWEIYAVVDGSETPKISVKNPNAKITLHQAEKGDGYILQAE